MAGSGEAIQKSVISQWIASSLTLLAMTVPIPAKSRLLRVFSSELDPPCVKEAR
jgi:hypothetical protein